MYKSGLESYFLYWVLTGACSVNAVTYMYIYTHRHMFLSILWVYLHKNMCLGINYRTYVCSVNASYICPLKITININQ